MRRHAIALYKRNVSSVHPTGYVRNTLSYLQITVSTETQVRRHRDSQPFTLKSTRKRTVIHYPVENVNIAQVFMKIQRKDGQFHIEMLLCEMSCFAIASLV